MPTIRDATPTDAEVIAAGNAAMALETESKQLDQNTLLKGVTNLLNDPTRGRYWVATQEQHIVGQIMVTWEWSDWRNGFFWWIQSVYIAPDHRRRGIFSALYRHVTQQAQTSGNACGLRLYVERDNNDAHKTYRALGMHDAGYNILEALL